MSAAVKVETNAAMLPWRRRVSAITAAEASGSRNTSWASWVGFWNIGKGKGK